MYIFMRDGKGRGEGGMGREGRERSCRLAVALIFFERGRER